MRHPPKPPASFAEDNIEVEYNGRTYFAAYYPQMGGYGSVCWIELDSSGCFDCYIWHDGEFAFGEEQEPTELHHCDPQQFIDFGTLVLDKARAAMGDK
jgi:hypothetical protein